MRDRVMIGIASVPERAASLECVLFSLAPQADRVFISLNGYADKPGFLSSYRNVEATVRLTNQGDAEKFAAIDEWDGYVLTCDDDILYPPDYVATIVAGIESHGRGNLVSFHGGTTHGWNGSHGAASVKKIRCLGDLVEDDTDVNVLGTGTLGYHTDGVPLWRGVFRSPNMADVYLACHARTFGIPMVALAHSAGWLRNLRPGDADQIYESNRNGDGTGRDTRAERKAELDRVDWTASPPVRPRVRVSIATCMRAHLMPALFDALEPSRQWADLEVGVYEDPSPTDYAAAHREALARGYSWHRFPTHLGRLGHWELVNQELADCRKSEANWFVFLPDDIRLVRHALAKAITTWQRLSDPATLTLWRLKDHEGQTNWTGRLPEDRGEAWEVFHVDGIYLCQRPTIEFLGYECPQTARRPRSTSSGVGRAMSLRMHAARKRMYRVNESLAVPLYPAEPSVMNPHCTDRRFEGIAL